ncbi:Down syndrome cell adhesion molecule-like protein 1 [Chamberlinius hualienensis]
MFLKGTGFDLGGGIVYGEDAAEFHGPRFILEPPGRLEFSNSTYSSVTCTAEGVPPPTISWINHQDGSQVRNFAGLRYVYSNGSLIFPPFKAEEYRQEVHAAIYQCVATSPVGTIKSRPVSVRAVVQQYFEVQVYDEFVIVGNTAVLKCNIPTFVKDYVTVSEWIRSGTTIAHSGFLAGNRYVVTPSGDLYVNQVTLADSHETFHCKTVHRLSGETRLSSPAKIVVTDTKSSVPPRVTHNMPVISIQQGFSVEMPCAAQGQPTPTFRWVKDGGKEIRPIEPSKRFRMTQGILALDSVQVADGGGYICIASNTLGEEKAETVLKVTVPLSVRIEPAEVSIDIGKSTTLNCVVNGYPVTSVTWTKDGQPLKLDDRIRLLTQYILRIETAQRGDKGMYQCFAKNNDEVAQGIAELKLGDVSPLLHSTFDGRIVQPETSLSVQCSASGNPSPEIRWEIDQQPIYDIGGHHRRVWSILDSEGIRVSTLNITSLSVQDGGDYTCKASNRAGEISYSAKVNVFGPPYIRPMADVTAVAGADLVLPCRAIGYPISSIIWNKDGATLGSDRRQIVYPNGTLVIHKVDRNSDGGSYTCIARNEEGDTARENLIVKVIIPPIMDISFPHQMVLQTGARARLQCVVTQGDLPLTIVWLKDGVSFQPSHLNVQPRKEDEFSSVLTFPSITTAHNGNYTCIAKNSAGFNNLTTQLVVEVPPHWVIQPSDTSTTSGGNATLDCVADGYPTPDIVWKRALGRHPEEYFDAVESGGRVKILSNGSLLVTDAADQDEGQYLCEASNGIGTGLSKVVTLKIYAAANFEVKYQNRTAKKSEKVTLHCESRGDSPIYISWRKNNEPLNTNGIRYSKLDRVVPYGVHSQLIIHKVSRDDEGTYYCNTWNSYGRDDAIIQLDIKEPPEVPSGLKIVDHGGRSVSLTWSQPYNGGSAIQEYVIQYKKASDDWMPQLPNITVPGRNASAIIYGLLPGTSYSFRVLAKNLLGLSLPSNGVGIATAEEAPAGAPQDVEVKPIGSDSVLITWKPPHRDLLNGDVSGYHVGYRMLNTSENFKFVTVEAGGSRRSSEDLSYKLSSLRKFTSYVVTVQAFNRMGKGPASLEVVATTEEDVPEKPPSDLRCWGISSHSINISWSQPPPMFQHGIVLGYKIFYTSIKAEESSIVQNRPYIKTGKMQATIHSLEKYTNYSVRALAFTKVGDGATTDPVYCCTLEDVPEAPGDIKVLAKSSNEVVVVWRPPNQPNGEILKYTVYMRQQPDKATRMVVDSGKLFLDIGGLKENQDYDYWLTASTAIGEGKSTRVVTHTIKTHVHAKIAAFSQKIVQPWNSDVIFSCPATGIPPPKREWWKGVQRLSSSASTPYTFNMDGSLVLKQSQRSDSGNYTCRVENIHGEDEVTHQLLIQGPPGPPVVIVTQMSSTSISLSWKTKDDGGSPIRGFSIRYKQEFRDWESVEVDVEEFYTLQKLQCGRQYQLTVAATNKLGYGQNSDVVVAATKGAVPGIPKTGEILFPNTTSAVLRLINWPSGGCPIHYFVIHYKHSFQRDWALISNNVQQHQESVFISDLRPGEKYKLQVTAHNDAGSTQAVYEFTTLLMIGVLSHERSQADEEDFDDDHTYYLDITIVVPIVSSAITVVIILVGVCVMIRRKRYAGYRHTKSNAGHSDLTPDTDSGVGGERKQKRPSSGTIVTTPVQPIVQMKRNSQAIDHHHMHHQTKKDDICPYATSNLSSCQNEDDPVAYNLQLRTFGRHDYTQRQETKPPPPYPGKTNLYSAVISRSNSQDPAKCRVAGVVLRPHRYPSVDEMHVQTRASAPEMEMMELESPSSPGSQSNRPQVVYLVDSKYRSGVGEEWVDVRQTVVSHFEPNGIQEPNQVPDLLYRGTDSNSEAGDTSSSAGDGDDDESETRMTPLNDFIVTPTSTTHPDGVLYPHRMRSMMENECDSVSNRYNVGPSSGKRSSMLSRHPLKSSDDFSIKV